MKKLLVCALVLMMEVFSANSYAAPPSDASLDELFKLTQVEQLLTNGIASFDQNVAIGVKQSLARLNLPPEKAAEINKTMAPMLENLSKRAREQLAWTNMRPRYMDLYRKTFSQEDIDGMIAFYKTPAGQSTIQKLPKLMQEISMMTQQMLTPLLAGIQDDMQKAVQTSQKPAGH